MAVNLSPVGGVAAQFFDNSGNVLTGGKIYTYSAGTTTPQATYTSATGVTFHSNPIILDASGRVPGGEIWLADNLAYKFVIEDSNNVLIGTYDNIIGINSTFLNFYTQEEIQTATAGQTVFTLSTVNYTPGTNSLSVFVDGVNQYDGSSYAYVETDSTTVTFTAGLHVGALVKFTTAISLSGGATNSSTVVYDPPFTGGVATTVQNKLAHTISVLDFGADPTGANDSHTAFVNAIATGGTVYVPSGTYIINFPIVCTNAFKLVGDGINSTVISRNFSPVVDSNGIFTIQQGGTEIAMRDMTLRSLSGQTGGCLLSIVPSASGLGLYNFSNIDFTTTGTSTHQYTLYFDGTAASTAPIGIRGLDMVGCQVFGGGVSTMLVKGVLKFSFLGGGVYTAGGVGTSNIKFDGTSTVKTQSFLFTPTDCSCPISFDYAINGTFGCGVMNAITNTANTVNIYGFGFTGSLQQNWANSLFVNTQTGISLATTAGLSITNTGRGGNYPVEMFGSIAGYQQSAAVSKVGQIGVGYTTTCPSGKTFSFTSNSGKLFTIALASGQAVLCFADQASSTITLVSNPSGVFQATSSPGLNYTGIYKSASSQVISVFNNATYSQDYQILNVGLVSVTTDPA